MSLPPILHEDNQVLACHRQVARQCSCAKKIPITLPDDGDLSILDDNSRSRRRRQRLE